VEALIVAAGGPVEHIRALIDHYGADAVAQVVVDDVRARIVPPACDEEVVQLDLRVGDTVVDHVLRVGAGGVTVKPGRADAPPLLVEQDLVELVASVFGPPSAASAVTRRVSTDFGEAPEVPRAGKPWWLDRAEPLARIAHSVVAACGPYRPDLGELAVRFGSDKWGGVHWYTQHYDRHFAHLRDRPIRLLEIGIGGYIVPTAGGASLRMWKHYFPRALVYGIDKFDKSPLDEQRLTTIVGDQNDAAFLTDVVERYGPFDIVVDDGSHLNSHQLASFETLFPLLRSGGWYVIEDLQTSYWPGYGGTSTGRTGPATGAGLMGGLLDGLHHRDNLPVEAGGPQLSPSYTDETVVGVHLYRGMGFVEKGLNCEPPLPGWVPRSPLFA